MQLLQNGTTSGGYNNVGGISGYNRGSIKYCYSMGTVYGSKGGVSYSGGGLIVGQQLTNGSAYTNYCYTTNTQSAYPVIGYKKNGSSTGCAKISHDTIKGWNDETITQKLTNKFCKDENIINDNYPILSWQT